MARRSQTSNPRSSVVLTSGTDWGTRAAGQRHGSGAESPMPRRHRTRSTGIIGSCRRGNRSVGQVAQDVEVPETAVRDWAMQAEADASERNGLTSSEREKLAALRRENRRLREDVDIRNRATAFFTKEAR